MATKPTQADAEAANKAAMAAFAAKRKATAAPKNPFSPSADKLAAAAKAKAAEPALSVTISSTGAGLKTSMALDTVDGAAEALRASLNELCEQIRQRNLTGFARFTGVVRIEVEVAVK